MKRLTKHLRVYTIIAALILLAILVAGSHDFLATVHSSIEHVSGRWWLWFLLAALVQLLGHWLRTLRTKTVIDEVKQGKTSSQFGALSIGYLFNTLLPFRAGEIIRALLIALRLRVSFLYIFTAVILERVIDLLFIGCSVIIISSLFSGAVARLLVVGALGAIVLSIVFLMILVLLARENRRVLAIIWSMTSWFNAELCNQMRFKVWSLIFGLQRFMNRKAALRRYAVLVILSWSCYIASTIIVVLVIMPGLNTPRTIVAASSPYVAVTSPAGPSYPTVYSQVLRPVVRAAGVNAPQVTQYVVISWLLLTIPMLVAGAIALVVLKVRTTKRAGQTTSSGFLHKLQRSEDISQEFPAFLDSYFSGDTLARVLHKLETTGQVSLVKFFKGGSDAITILVLSKDQLRVKKIIPLAYEARLKAQYDWLVRHQELDYLVKVLGEEHTSEYYAIDLAYDAENIPLFEYIHSTSFAHSKKALSTVWQYLYKHIYHDNTDRPVFRPEARDAFIEKHIFGCLDQASAADPELARATQAERIAINGREYDNLYQIMAKIKRCKPAWRDIATFRQNDIVHGDMAIDNILISPRTRKPLIIDPAPDGNIINGPVFDMGKLTQSLYCGYEFLFRNDDPVHLQTDGSINYRDHRSSAYTQLWEYLHDELAPQYISDAERRSLLFHAAALHIRVLKHRVYINPENVLQFYAVGVRTLNAFLEQYEQDEKA